MSCFGYHKPHQQPLRIKLKQLINNCGLPKCPVAFSNIHSFNVKLIESTQSMPYVNKKVKESRNFSFSKDQSSYAHYLSTEPFEENYNEIQKKFLNELTPEEIITIKKNKDFYIQDKNIKENLKILKYDTLLERLNKEEQNSSYDNMQNDTRLNKKLFLNLKKNKNHTFSPINQERKKEGETKEDNYIIQQKKYYDSLVRKEILSDKKRNIEKRRKIQLREQNLNKIYQESRRELDNINKEMKKAYNKKGLGFLITQISKNGSELSKQQSNISIKPIDLNTFLSPMKKNNNKNDEKYLLIRQKAKEDELEKETIQKIKEIYSQGKKVILPPI